MPTTSSFNYKAPSASDFENFDRTRDESDTNIPQNVMDAITSVSQANEVEVILRPMNPDALWHLKHGAAAKGMAIHGKSANKGPVRGLIPITSSLSKIDPKDPERVKKYQEENRHSLSESEKSLKDIEEKLLKAKQAILARNPEKEGNITQEELMHEARISMDSFDAIVQPVKLKTQSGQQITFFLNLLMKNGFA